MDKSMDKIQNSRWLLLLFLDTFNTFVIIFIDSSVCMTLLSINIVIFTSRLVVITEIRKQQKGSACQRKECHQFLTNWITAVSSSKIQPQGTVQKYS